MKFYRKLGTLVLAISIGFFNFPFEVFDVPAALAATEDKWASSHITGTFTNPNNALGNADGVWAGQLNVNTNETSRWAMEDPTGSIAGTQTISVLARKGSNSGTPTVALNLYENGSLVQSIVGDTGVTSTSGQTVSGTFAASAITNANNVEIEVVMTSAGGNPSTRNSAQIDEIEWTVNLASAPTVTTQAASAITTSSATLNGNITATGGANATVRGFAWGTNSTLSNGDTATTTENGSFGTGAFTSDISSLSCGTTYYSRAYATNPSGTGLGTIESFNTSACPLFTISGTIFTDEGTTQLNSAGKTIMLRIGTSTPGFYATTTIAGTGVWRVSNVPTTGLFIGMPVQAWVDGDVTFRAATFTKASSTSNNISGLDLYQNRVIVKHEGFTGTSTTNTDLDTYDGDNDGDIQFRVASGALHVNAGQELHIAPGTEFYPGSANENDIVLHGNAATTNPDGDLHLATGLRQDGTATSSILTLDEGKITLAGNWFASSTSRVNDTGTGGRVDFNSTSTQQKNIIATSSDFVALVFNGSGGSWTFGSYAATTSLAGQFTITAGTVTAPSTNLALGGPSFTRNGSFIHNSGTTTFYGSSAQSINSAMTGTNAFNNVVFRGAGTKTFGANSASTTNFFIESGSGAVTAPSTYLSIAGNYSNSGIFTHNSGTTTFNGTSGTQTLSGTMNVGSGFNNVEFSGAAAKVFSAAASTTNFFAYSDAGTITYPSTGISIAGNYSFNGTGAIHSGPKFFDGALQSLSGNTGGRTFGNHVHFVGSGTKTLADGFAISGSSGHLTIGSGVTLSVHANGLSLTGNFTNNGTFSQASGTTTFNGTSGTQTLSGTMTGTSAFANVEFSGAGSKTFNASASTTNFTVNAGSGNLFAPSTYLSVSGNYANNEIFLDNGGTVLFDGTNQTLSGAMIGTNDDFSHVKFLGSGTKTISANASTTDFTIGSGVTVFAPTLLSIGGNFANSGTFTAPATTYFSGSSAQSLSGTMTGAANDFNDIVFLGAGTKSFGANAASTTNFTVNSGSGAVTAPSTLLSITENFTNNSDFDANGGTVLLSGSSQQTLSGQMTGTSDDFNNLTIINTSGTGATQSVVFAASASTTGAYTMAASTSAQFLAGGTYTFNTLSINGGSATTRTWLRSSSAGSAWNLVTTGSPSVSYVNVMDSNACGGSSINASDETSVDATGNSCWEFPVYITLSGTLYAMNETTAVTTGKTIKVAVGTSTPGVFTTTSDGSGNWSINSTNIPSPPLGRRFLAWVDGDATFRAATFTKASSTSNNIPKIDLYQNRLVIKHEGFTGTSTTNTDLAFYDNDNDSDIQFTSVAGGALNVFKSEELHIAPGTEFAPGGSVTLHGNASTTNPDGDLHLAYGARQDGVATSTILSLGTNDIFLAGNWFASSSSRYIFTNPTASAVVFTSTSTSPKSIIATSSSFGFLDFNGVGGTWSFGTHAATSSFIQITNGNVVAPSSYLAILEDFYLDDGSHGTFSFNHNGGTVIFAGTGSTNDVYGTTTGSNAFNNVVFRGGTSKFFYNFAGESLSAVSSTTNLTIESSSGVVTFPKTLTISGNFTNNAAFDHMDGTVFFSSTSAQSLSGTMIGTSAFASTTFIGAGTKTFNNNASTTNRFTIEPGATVVAPTLLTIGGNYTNNGSFTSGSGTVYFSSTTNQTIAGTLNTSATDFANVEFLGSGTKTISSNASTTGFSIASGVTVSAPTLLSISGDYTNNGSFTDNSGTIYFSGAGQTISGTLNTSSTDFATTSFIGSGTKTFSSNASTTGFSIASGATVVAPTLLSISRNYTNNGNFTDNSGTVYLSGSSQQTLSGQMTGTSDDFNNLTILNTSGTGATQSIIFGAAASTTGAFTMAASTSAQFLASATSSFSSLNFQGTSAATRTWLRSSSPGTRYGFVATTSPTTVTYTDVQDASSCGDPQGVTIDATGGTNVDSGNNCGWNFFAVTISGILYGMDETTPITGLSKTIKIATGGATPDVFTTTTSSSDGTWSQGINPAPALGQRFLAFVDGDPTFRAATFTKASSTSNNIPKIDLYQNRLVIKHEGFTGTSTTNTDLAFYDNDNDSDIQFTSVAGGALNVFKSEELHIAPGTEFSPGGEVTLHGNASTTNPDGDLHLASGPRQNGVSTSSILTMESNPLVLAGNFFASSTSIYQSSSDTTFLSTSTAQKVIIATSSPFHNLYLSAGGRWTFGNNSATTTGWFGIAGSATSSSDTLTIGDWFQVESTGSFSHNNGTVIFNKSDSQWLQIDAAIGANAFYNLIFRDAGGKSFFSPASTTNMTIESTSGSVTAPSSLTIAGNYVNSGTFTHNSGTVYFSSTSAQTISGALTETSAFASTTFLGSGTKTFSNNASTTAGFTIGSGTTVVAPTLLTVGGNYSNSGTFSHQAGAVFFDSSSAQTIAGTLTGTSAFASTSFLGSGTKTFSSNASTTGFTIGSGVTVAAPTLLSIRGNYANSGTFTAGSGTTTVDGTTAQIFSGTMIGASAFRNLDILNSSATTSFASSASTTANFYARTPNSRLEFFAGATTTLQNLLVEGSEGSPIYLHSRTPGSLWNLHVPGIRSLTYANIKDSDACTSDGNIPVDGTNINGGNTFCWDFPTEPDLRQLHYRWRKNNGTETSAAYQSDEDTAIDSTVYEGDDLRLRILISNASGGSATGYQYRLEHASSSCTVWLPVPTPGALVGEHWVMENTVNLADEEATTDSEGLTNPGGKSFVAGYVKDTSNQTPAHTLTNTQFSEFEYSIKSTNSARSGIPYCFRLTNAGSVTNFTYSVTPQVTLGLIVRGGGGGGGGDLEGSGSGPVVPGGGQEGGGDTPGEGSGEGEGQGGGSQGGGGGDLGYFLKKIVTQLQYAFAFF